MNVRALCLTTILHAASLIRGYTINITINAVDTTPKYVDSYHAAPFVYRPVHHIHRRPKPSLRPYHHHHHHRYNGHYYPSRPYHAYHRVPPKEHYYHYKPRPQPLRSPPPPPQVPRRPPREHFREPHYLNHPESQSINRPEGLHLKRPEEPHLNRPEPLQLNHPEQHPLDSPEPHTLKLPEYHLLNHAEPNRPEEHQAAVAVPAQQQQPEPQHEETADAAQRPAYQPAASASAGGLGKFLRRPPFARPGRTGSGSDVCFGGARCTFFLQCWMAGGSLGSSCGPLLSCCITPSDAIIKPRYYGPVKNDPYCGRSGGRISRIVGGKEAEFGQFPWQAFIQVSGSRCGGTLVSRQHVVTAGHCVAKYQYNPSSIRVTLGDYVLNSDVESIPSETFGVRQIRIHPNFRFTPQADRYDVAVLVLDRPVVYKPNILPICLPPKDAHFVTRVAEAAGWGALEPGSKVRPRVLQHVHVPVLPNQVCESWHRRQGINIRIHDEMLCAGYERGGKDSCQGDSGGPLMLNDYGVYYLIGIVSAGYSCAKNYQPGIYHRVSSSSDWISSSLY